jgi:hypothetical protein
MIQLHYNPMTYASHTIDFTYFYLCAVYKHMSKLSLSVNETTRVAQVSKTIFKAVKMNHFLN